MAANLSRIDDIALSSDELERTAAARLAAEALEGAEDGELFIEKRFSETLIFDDGRLRQASYDENAGFGLRAVSGDVVAYTHASELSEAALKRAAATVRTIAAGGGGSHGEAPAGTNRRLYGTENPISEMGFADKVALVARADQFARSLDTRVRQVSVGLTGQWQAVEIIRADGQVLKDIRPLTRFNVAIVTADGKRQETGSAGAGGRTGYGEFLRAEKWQDLVREALRQSLVLLEAQPAPAGEMDVVLGPGWPGILLHEAIGHGLEGDFNRKKTSAFCGLMGQKIASDEVSVVDDGTLPGRRGSLNFDDEGTPTSCTPLIENGILVGFMQDRQNARLMAMKPTGNGRRQGFDHAPMPRMTNTYMLAGKRDPQEIIASVKNGLYAVSFGGGQVDITSGKFVFTCTEAYRIENGRIGAPVKGATIIGAGADALMRISMVGNDLELDPGIGTCGKQGQGVPVGVGQPTLRLDRITVGGTAT
jgi:TldD protein